MESEFKKSLYIIDRFEDNGWAVLEDEKTQTFHVPRFWLPSLAKEGDVIVMALTFEEASSTISMTIDNEETQARQKQISQLRTQLRKGSSGDIDL